MNCWRLWPWPELLNKIYDEKFSSVSGWTFNKNLSAGLLLNAYITYWCLFTRLTPPSLNPIPTLYPPLATTTTHPHPSIFFLNSFRSAIRQSIRQNVSAWIAGTTDNGMNGITQHMWTEKVARRNGSPLQVRRHRARR